MSEAPTSNGTGFSRPFDEIRPLILAEWPDVASDQLDDTQGDFDKVVDVVAKATEHTRTLVKKHLAELESIEGGPQSKWWDEIEQKVKRAVDDARGQLADTPQQVADKAKEQVEQHPLYSLLVALGLGILLGLLMRGGRRD